VVGNALGRILEVQCVTIAGWRAGADECRDEYPQDEVPHHHYWISAVFVPSRSLGVL